MQLDDKQYAVLYKINVALNVEQETIRIDPSEIVSITIIHNYDIATYPIIRLRLYSDITVLEKLVKDTNSIQIMANLDGAVYRVNEKEQSSPKLITSASSIAFTLKGYIENKNTPVSFMDQYENGLLKQSNLNQNIKVPIELYGYQKDLIHKMKQKPESIYKDISVQSVIETCLKRNGIYQYHIDPAHNQTKYDQILLPNLDILNTISFLNEKYGLYQKSGQLYGDLDQLYICDSDSNFINQLLTIYVMKQSDTNASGLIKLNTNQYGMCTMAQNVSFISETEIERTLHAENMTSINFKSLKVDQSVLTRLFGEKIKSDAKINAPSISHRNISDYVLSSHIARINESITKIDISGIGYDIGKMKINTRYGLLFESPIRGLNVNQYYRPTFVNHVIKNLSGELFYAQTSMNLVSN